MTMKRPGSIALRWFFGSLLFVLTILPIAMLLYRSVFGADGASFESYREAYGRSVNLRAMVNTIVISVATVVLAGAIAIPAAWLVTRTDLPGHRRFRYLLLLPYIIPPYLGAIAWINLCNPSVGWLNRLVRAVSGNRIETAFDIYTMTGVVWVLALFFYTFIYLNCISALENADPSLEEAARISGASPLRVFTTITIPLIRPALIAGTFLVFAAAAASFGVPEMIGRPGRVHVMTTQIYSSIKTGGIEGYRPAAALSASLLVVALGASIIADRMAHSRRITAISGKSARISRVRLGGWRWWAFGFVALIITLACALPLASIVLTSFMKVTGQFAWDGFTLDKYRYVLFERQSTARGFINSFMLAFGAATLAIVVGTALAYLKGHPRRRSGPIFDACVSLPYATPGTILALGLVLLWSWPFRLTDTLWILLIAYFAKYLSFSVKALTTNVQQVDVTLEEAARVSGAGFWKTIRTIWLPLLRPGILASWFLVFMPAFSELTMSVLLVGPGTETVGTVLFDLQEYADPPSASVVAVLILALILGASGIAIWVGGKGKGLTV